MNRRRWVRCAPRALVVVAFAMLVSASSCGSEPDSATLVVPMSSDQQQVVAELGQPSRFTLTFVSDDNPSVGGRYETWHYDGEPVTVSFVDGNQTARRDAENGATDGLATTTYLPGRFDVGMSVEEFLVAVGTASFIEQPVVLSPDNVGRLVVVTGAVAGFDDDGLAYVETVPLNE